MTLSADPQALQIIEHKLKMLQERLKQNMAQQYDLQQNEGRLRCEMQRIENEKYAILETH